MNIVREVLGEHSKAMRDRVVAYVGTRPRRFAQLVDVFLAGPYRVTQRSGWPLSFCVERHPELIKPHLKRIIKELQSPGLPDSAKRNIVRLLQFVDIPKASQGAVAEACFGFLSNPKEAIAVRAFSMTVLGNIVREQPGLAKELKLILEDQLSYGSSGIGSRAMKVIKSLQA